MSQYNYYKAAWLYVTAKRAMLMGIPVSRHYGYYVLIFPPVLNGGKKPGRERIEAWCKTKAGALRCIESNVEAQVNGYFSCPCGSNKQARSCCGIPKKGA